MADVAILQTQSLATPNGYTIPGAQEIILKSVKASFDGTGAGASWVPVLQFVAPNGFIVCECPVPNAVAAGGSADVSWFPRVGGGGGLTPAVPGYEIDYVETSTNVLVTSKTQATPDLVLQGDSITYDGNTRIQIQFYSTEASVFTTAGGLEDIGMFVDLWDNSTDLGIWSHFDSGTSSGVSNYCAVPCDLLYITTPTAGAHQYSTQAWLQQPNTTEGSFNAPTGSLPMFMRIVTVPVTP